MESLLKWAILNGATAGEDAPARSADAPVPQRLDPAVIDAILGKPASVQMTECLDAVEHPETPLEAREVALDDLEMLVENIDNASNLEPLNLWPRLLNLYNDAAPSVRIGALWVSGTAVQHNPNAQKAFGKHNGMQSALSVLQNDSVDTVRTKALYCVSSFIRANVHGLTDFVANNGLPIVQLVVENGSGALRQKAFFLLHALIDEALDEVTPEELRPGMYLPNAIAELGFVEATVNALKELTEANHGMAYEQAVGFLTALCATEKGKQAVKECDALKGVLGEAKARFPDIETDELSQILS
ncbi:hsp70 nucleotide exchange factor fes1 [Coemansia sp. RSA 2440]|nr:hsp70 nucleotide exchange factor fes1 [Coemansia sp. RSA 1938]KAJ2443106.1 hsp70 nucleotide exchange factor fes1 [Coemansia sp. RSA 2440]